jgi:hypothetical protein
MACGKESRIRDGHSSWAPVARRLQQPTRTAGSGHRSRSRLRSRADASRRPYSILLPVGFAVPPTLPPARCALTAPFHPCCAPSRSLPTGGGLGVGDSGLFSVALSLGSRPPDVIRHRRSMEPGLSSPEPLILARKRERRAEPERPSGRLTQLGWGLRRVPSRGKAPEGLGPGRDVARPAAVGEQIHQRGARRCVGDPVDPLRPEMALERSHHVVGN